MTNEEYVRELSGSEVPHWIVEQLAEELDRRDELIARLQHTANELSELQRNREYTCKLAMRLLTLATKWCERDHHDWDEIKRLAQSVDYLQEFKA